MLSFQDMAMKIPVSKWNTNCRLQRRGFSTTTFGDRASAVLMHGKMTFNALIEHLCHGHYEKRATDLKKSDTILSKLVG